MPRTTCGGPRASIRGAWLLATLAAPTTTWGAVLTINVGPTTPATSAVAGDLNPLGENGGFTLVNFAPTADASSTRAYAGGFVRTVRNDGRGSDSIEVRGVGLGTKAPNTAGASSLTFGTAPALVYRAEGGGVGVLKGVFGDEKSEIGVEGVGVTTYDATNGVRLLADDEYTNVWTAGAPVRVDLRLREVVPINPPVEPVMKSIPVGPGAANALFLRAIRGLGGQDSEYRFDLEYGATSDNNSGRLLSELVFAGEGDIFLTNSGSAPAGVATGLGSSGKSGEDFVIHSFVAHTVTISAGLRGALDASTTVSVDSGGVVRFDAPAGAASFGANSRLVVNGVGVVELKGADRYRTGGTTVNGGTLRLLDDETIADKRALDVNTGGVLDLNGHKQTFSSFGGGGSVTNSSDSPAMLVVGEGDAGGEFTGAVDGPTSLRKVGAGTLTLSGAGNTYTGATSVAGGVLRLGAEGGVSPLSRVDLSATGTIDLNGKNLQVAGLSATTQTTVVENRANGTTATLTVNQRNGESDFGGLLRDNSGETGATGKVALKKTGQGALRLSGPQGYTGGTTLSGGRLSLAGAQLKGPFTLTAGELAGSGRIEGPFFGSTLSGAGVGETAAIRIGGSIGLIEGGDITLEGDGLSFEVEIDSSLLGPGLVGAADMYLGDGDLTILGDPKLVYGGDLSLSHAPIPDGAVFPFLRYLGSWNGGYFAGAAPGSLVWFGADAFRIEYDVEFDDRPGRFVALVAVPEPASAIALATLALAPWRRHRDG